MERNLAFVLGVASPHVIDLASSYATFAARGQQVEPTVLVRVVGPNGGVLWEASPAPRQAFSSDVADSVNAALQSVVTDGTGTTAQGLGRPAAGKTGTTNDNMSAWFVGYTPQVSTAVMLVKDGPNGQPVSLRGTGGMSSVTGGSFPAAIWTAYMRGALKGQPVQEFVTPSAPTAPPSASASPSASVSPSPSTSPSSSTPASPTAPASPTVPPSDTTSPSAPLPTLPPSPEPPAAPTAVPEPPPASAAADVPEPRSAASPVSPAAG
jgi:membrane peptidoglycan carboxypeptidase